MKRKVLLLLTAMILLFIGILIVNTFSLFKKKEELSTRLLKLVKIPLVDLDSAKLQITSNKKLIVVYYSTTCGNCQSELEDIMENIHQFDEYNVVLISMESINEIKRFVKRYRLQRKNVFIAKIRPEDTFDTFGSLSIPHTFIYGRDSILIKEFSGPFTVETMLKTVR
ncbi:MAG: TlpA family protein disulfide reductase [Cyclobacteriaceae bacterium]|jgi:peroxiredoxin